MKHRIVYRAEFFKEGEVYVSLAPELDISSFGETVDEARDSLREAIEAFVEECDKMGTFKEVMEEAGFAQRGDLWVVRQPVAAELLTLG